MKYYIEKTINTDFETALTKTTEALEKEGFGILSEIDIREKFKEKLNIDFRNYKILGACNPSISHQALQKEDKIGTLLPCNVIIQQSDNNQVEIAAVNPVLSLQEAENKELNEIAETVKKKLENVISDIT